MRRLYFFIVLLFVCGCAASNFTVRPCDQRTALDCQMVFQQFARTIELDLGITGLTIFNIEFGAKGGIEIDSITADYILHIHTLCVNFNNCILTEDEYKKEMQNLREEQIRLRNTHTDCAETSNPLLIEEANALFSGLNRKQQTIAIQRMLNRLGYDLIIDGAIGKQTKNAIEKFTQSQKENGHLIDINRFDGLYDMLWKSLMNLNHLPENTSE